MRLEWMATSRRSPVQEARMVSSQRAVRRLRDGEHLAEVPDRQAVEMSGFGSRAFIHRRAAADEIRRIVGEPVEGAGGNEAGRLICGKWRRGIEMLGSGVRAGAGLDALTDEDALFSDSCVIWRPSCSSAGGASRPPLPI